MRMWMVPKEFLCDRHLLGAHVELHMMVGAIKKNKNLNGYYVKNLISTSSINKEHDSIVEEMNNRNMKHKSNLVYEDKLNKGIVHVDKNVEELKRRCSKCRERIIKGERDEQTDC